MATNNAGKLREARAIAGGRLEILSLDDIGYHQDIEETADTLSGNALIKVRAIKAVTDLDVFADDTGLIVDALDGAPGVHTARYAGEACDPDANMDLLLRNMEGVADRRARFATCIALSHDGGEYLFEGTAEGSIARERSGSHGFGYDPVFISEETGKCFAEMSDEEKNGISHRGRALRAMMKWLGALCVALMAILPAKAASSADWALYNTFDDKVEYVFDTESKTYFLVQAQAYDPASVDNQDKLCFLFTLDKESDELRPYNSQNFLSESLIRTAYYNAEKRYLLIVYSDMMIDMLYDNGDVYPIHALKNFTTSSTKEVRSISFDPARDRAYLATDFGYVEINDDKHEVAASGVFGRPIDRMVRAGDFLLATIDGKLYRDDIDSPNRLLSDFEETDWAGGDEVMNLVALGTDRCLMTKNNGGSEDFFILTFRPGTVTPVATPIGGLGGASIVENKRGLLLGRNSQIIGIDRTTGERDVVSRRAEDYAVAVGSWDMRDVYYMKSREGYYSLRRGSDGGWSVTRDVARPDAPAAFRSNFMRYLPDYGMMVNSHGTDRNFTTHTAPNPILLSSWKNNVWTPLGVPYLAVNQRFRLVNPCGFAQDPDNPDVFYFGSVLNGLLRYNVKDYSSLLHVTRSNDTPDYPGHVSAHEPYSRWPTAFIMMNPRFDRNGNLVVAHVNTNAKDDKSYTAEIWMWTPENRRASVSPETYRPFKALKVNGPTPAKSVLALPLESAAARNMVVYFAINDYNEPFVVYDHNGTPEDENDDRQTLLSSLRDQDGTVSYNYIYCAVEDPQTGLVWVGTNNGVFTMNPAQQFSEVGVVSRIKVSRNDGTSLADYLLDGIGVNDISIDGSGRKWFSLGGGGIVCTSADGRTILQEITSDNSMLPSDNVYASAYDPSRNSMMLSTEAGLCEYFLSGSAGGGSGSSVRAYPNPVRPDYYGWVTIDGLDEDCIVKITDSAGNIVRELGSASGGQVQWDACNSRLEKVASGVYFVLASSGPGGGSFSEKTKILVIKD